MYYLRSRYYNSAYARFLNADGYLWDKNIFAYCQNNAVNRADNNGNASASCIGDVTEDPVGGYHIDLSMAGNSSLWHSPLLNGEWSGYFVQTPYTYSLDHLPLPQGKTATPEMLKTMATEAAQKYIQNNTGSGAVYGTKGHTYVETQVKAQNWSNVGVEVSFKGNVPAYYGEKGSVRLDIVLFSSNSKEIPIYAIDLKFGITPLTQRRIDQINEQLPNPIQIDQVP